MQDSVLCVPYWLSETGLCGANGLAEFVRLKAPTAIPQDDLSRMRLQNLPADPYKVSRFLSVPVGAPDNPEQSV